MHIFWLVKWQHNLLLCLALAFVSSSISSWAGFFVIGHTVRFCGVLAAETFLSLARSRLAIELLLLDSLFISSDFCLENASAAIWFL